MTAISRRSMAAGAGLLVGGIALGARAQQVSPQLASAVPVPKVTPRPLTINPEKVKGLSANLLRTHHDTEYAGTVKKLNG